MADDQRQIPLATPEQVRKWFSWYVAKLENDSVNEPCREGQRYRCPCCHFRTLSERGGFDVCPVCFWEDDGQDDHDADVIRGGPNSALSLMQSGKLFEISCV